MSRAGCCCGGGPDPGECCDSGGYSEQFRRYQVTIEVGPAIGLGLDLNVKYDNADCGTFDCDPTYCPGQTPITIRGVGTVTTSCTVTWGGGNGVYGSSPIFPKYQLVDCSPCFPGIENQPIDRQYTISEYPKGGADGVLEYVEPTSGSWTVPLTWISGSIDPVLNAPAVSATIYRGISSGAQANPNIKGCYDDSPCEQGMGMVVSAYLGMKYSEPCNAYGLYFDGTDAPSVLAQALYYGCRDRDNRYFGENRYGVREWTINRVNKCGSVGFALYTDGVTPIFGTNFVQQVDGTQWAFYAAGDVCADGTLYGQPFAYYPCNNTTPYSVNIVDTYPDDCPAKAGWYDAKALPHPFPLVINVVRLPPSPPTITTSTPGSGPAAGGTQITISGTNFIQVTDVFVGGNRCPTLVGSNGPNQIIINAPAGTAGTTVPIIVTTDGGSATRANAFTYT
jgi:hypothetical protein